MSQNQFTLTGVATLVNQLIQYSSLTAYTHPHIPSSQYCSYSDDDVICMVSDISFSTATMRIDHVHGGALVRISYAISASTHNSESRYGCYTHDAALCFRSVLDVCFRIHMQSQFSRPVAIYTISNTYTHTHCIHAIVSSE